MNKQKVWHWLPLALLEIASWSALALTFMYFYIQKFHFPISSVWPHFKLLLIGFISLVSFRLASWKFIGNKKVATWVVAIAIAAAFALVLSYYAMVLAGLASWGRVITWILIRTYSSQILDLSSIIGYDPRLMVAAVASVAIIIVACIKRWLVVRDWTRQLALKSSSIFMMVCIPIAGCIVAIRIFMFIEFPYVPQKEPLSMTMFPSWGAIAMQSHSSGGTPALNAEEIAERNRYSRNRNSKNRNVILIVGDALRADHMSIYGYKRVTTPFLKNLSGGNNVETINNVKAVCAESSCGLMAIAASRYVHEIPGKAITLQEILKLHGYKIQMVLGGDHTNFYGLREAYGDIDSYYDASHQKRWYMNDDSLVMDKISTLEEHDPSQPVMLQFHFMSTHALGRRHDSSLKFQPSANYATSRAFGKKLPSNSSEFKSGVNYYDNGVFQLDNMIMTLMDKLREKGYLDNTIVVITGDHGEMLGEHGVFGHASQIYEPALNIPLVIIRHGYESFPLMKGVVASQIDIAPTILRELDMPVPSTWRGNPLQNDSTHEFISFQQSSLVGLYDLRKPGTLMKYWRDFTNGTEYLFNLSEDPRELNNIINQADDNDLGWWRKRTMASGLIIH